MEDNSPEEISQKYKTIRVCWHSHSPIPLFFDYHNRRHLRRVDRYLDNMKEAGINAIAFTPHDFINLRNPKLYPKKFLSFWRSNITPETQYEILAKKANEKEIIILPGLEIETSERWETFPYKKIHLGVVHWNPKVLYHNRKTLLKPRILKDVLKNIPPDAVVDLKHPWDHKYGAASFIDLRRLKKILSEHNILIESSGMVITFYTVLKKTLKKFPWLLRSEKLKKRLEELKKSVSLEDFKEYGITAGGDNHSIHPYPLGGGFIEIKFPKEQSITKERIVKKIKNNEGRIFLPQAISFKEGILNLLKTTPALYHELFIQTPIISKREKLRKKLLRIISQPDPDMEKVKNIVYRLNEIKIEELADNELLTIIRNTYLD